MISEIMQAVHLLDPRSRRILMFLLAVQVTLSGLDLAGVLILGIVAALSAASVTGQSAAFINLPEGFLASSGLDEITLILALAALAALLLLAKSVIAFLLVRRTLRFLANRQAMVSSSLAEKLLSTPLQTVQALSSQQRAYSLTTSANAATLGVIGNAVTFVAELSVLFVLAIAVLVVDPVVAIFTIVFFVAIGLILNQVLGNIAYKLGSRITDAEIQSLAEIQNVLRAYREVSVAGRRIFIIDKFRQLRWRAAQYQADNQMMTQISKYTFEVGLTVGAIILGIWQLSTQEPIAAVAVIAVFLAAAGRIMPSLVRMQQAYLGLRSSLSIAGPILDLQKELRLAAPEGSEDRDIRERVLRGALSDHAGFKGDVQLSNVTFAYPGARLPAIHSATLEIEAGDSLALVGPTGAGKSTLADLILGVAIPDSGSVLVSGHEPTKSVAQWPGAIGYVPQETYIVQGSIRTNVALGIPDHLIDEDRVWEALERAQLHLLLKNQREQLDTEVGEHGVKLSGGQRQRLGIARALYTRPKLLVLDEATSALDSETERDIAEALNGLHGEVTSIIIAHRLATVRHCTRVAYMEAGFILCIGSFEEVRRNQPGFDRQANLLGII